MNIFLGILARGLKAAAGRLHRLYLCLTVGSRLREVDRWVADRGDLRLRLDYSLSAEDVVWDVGAYEGQWSSDISAKFGCQVHAFEPMLDFSERLRDRFCRNPRITVHAFGLGVADCLVTMTAAGDGSSHVEQIVTQENSDRGLVAIRDVRKIFRELGAERVALLKLNIEGAEYDLLEAITGEGLVTQFDALQIQFHDFVANAAYRRAAITAVLERTHQRTWCYPFVWENWLRKK